MDISVIIPAYNNSRTIGAVLRSLKNQVLSNGTLEVIVIDDCSKDDTSKICESYGFKVVTNEQNKGLGFSLNKGIMLTNNEIVVTLHGDAVALSRTWLSELTQPFVDPSIDASCSLQKEPDLNSDYICLWEKLLWAKLDAHNAFNDKADAYRRSTLTQIGLFDYETFRTAGEDEDLLLRLRRVNKKVVATNAPILHDHHNNYKSSFQCLQSLLSKEFTFGRAGGALRRKFPFYKFGAYIYPVPNIVGDGIFRTVLCLSIFIPWVNLVSIPLLFVFSAQGGLITVKKTGIKKAVVLYPLFNLTRYMWYTAGYCVGFLTKKQR